MLNEDHAPERWRYKEQARMKHAVLSNYLTRWALICGSSGQMSHSPSTTSTASPGWGGTRAAGPDPRSLRWRSGKSSWLGRLVAGGQLIYDPEQSARIAPIVGDDFGAYVVTAWGIQCLLGLGMLD
jgi:hypothetical protein